MWCLPHGCDWENSSCGKYERGAILTGACVGEPVSTVRTCDYEIAPATVHALEFVDQNVLLVIDFFLKF